MKKALVIGIDKYKNNPLKTCVNDAKCVGDLLEHNEDESKNFDVVFLTDKDATRPNIRRSIRQLFKNDDDIALLYFSGHGVNDDNDGFIVAYDYVDDDYGISMPEIFKFVNRSKCKNKIVIFDCCYSGLAGSTGMIGDQTVLSDGTIILTASRKNEPARIKHGEPNSVFTKLFVQGLEGAASDLFGNTSPSSIYAFIDKALGTWEQRPIFKSNVDRFVSLRLNTPLIELSILKLLSTYFVDKNHKLRLNPSFEDTNFENSQDRHMKPYKISENCQILKNLQKYNRNGLVIPLEEENLYETAMKSKHCVLTKLGKYYFELIQENKI